MDKCDKRFLRNIRIIPKRLLVASVLFLFLFLGLGLLSVSKVSAHPHVWIDAAVIIHRNDLGGIAAVEPVWIFDDLYTATLLPDLDQDQSGDVGQSELQKFAEEAVNNLYEWGYFLDARMEQGKVLNFEKTVTTEAVLLNNRLLLRFKLTLEQPITAASVIELKMYDPSYFISINLVEERPVSFLSKAKDVCQYDIIDPQNQENNQTPLSELFFSDEEVVENPDLGSVFAQTLRMSCQ